MSTLNLSRQCIFFYILRGNFLIKDVLWKCFNKQGIQFIMISFNQWWAFGIVHCIKVIHSLPVKALFRNAIFFPFCLFSRLKTTASGVCQSGAVIFASKKMQEYIISMSL